jgi:hypothetical protein
MNILAALVWPAASWLQQLSGMLSLWARFNKRYKNPSQPLLHDFVRAAVRVLQVLALRGGQ